MGQSTGNPELDGDGIHWEVLRMSRKAMHSFNGRCFALIQRALRHKHDTPTIYEVYI